MAHSHHSHSGQFCEHAVDALEAVVQTAIDRKLKVLCLTEHMPRGRDQDIYAGEKRSIAEQGTTFADYHAEALRLGPLYADRITLLIGFESEWIHGGSSLSLITSLRSKYHFDTFVGSIHHVLGIPIDFDRASYDRARSLCGDGSDAAIAVQYLDEQLEMLHALQPPIVGHLDLIRLLADDRDRSLKEYGEEVWIRVERNVRFIVTYGGLIELNSAAIRKGMREPYPGSDVCKLVLREGGRFVMSDDSHGIAQVAHSYERMLEFIKAVGIQRIHYLDVESGTVSSGREGRKIITREISVADITRAYLD